MKYCLSLCLLLAAAGLRAQNTYPYPATGRIGIGTNTPSTDALLHIHNGNLKITNPAPYLFGVDIDMTVSSGAWAREYGLSVRGAGKMAAFGAYAVADTLTYVYIGGNTTAQSPYASPWMIFRPDGNVGIGTLNAYTRLSVNGGVTILSPGSSTTARPPVSVGTITGEIRGTSPNWYLGDDGFLRLSAGGGSNVKDRRTYALYDRTEKGEHLLNKPGTATGINTPLILKQPCNIALQGCSYKINSVSRRG